MSRFIKLWLRAFAVAAALSFSCGRDGGSSDVSSTRFAMHTVVTCRAIAADDETARRALEASFRAIEEAEAIASYVNAESELSRLNAGACAGSVAVSPALAELLSLGGRYEKATEGWFDPSLGAVIDAYGIKSGAPRWPADEEVAAARAKTGYDAVAVDARGRAVAFERPGMRLDFSAMAKGWAVDRAVSAMKAAGAKGGMVEAGGEVSCFGGGPPGRPWRVGIKHPRRGGLYGYFSMKEGACATSGDYEQRYRAEGREFSHLFNPRTGRPTPTAASVTVFAPSCAEADAWATALAVMPPATAAAVLKRPSSPACLIMREAGSAIKEERFKTVPPRDKP